MRKLLLPVSLLLMAFGLKAQISVITPYPAPAQSLTRGLNPSTLTVQVSFTSACTNSKVTIAFPASVTYVPGTVTQTGGTLSGGSGGIIESNISNTSAPVFDILNVTGSGNITFTLSRQAGCGALSSGKDTVKVTGSCGSAVENGANINTYNLLSPSLSLTPAAAVTGAFLGDTYTRNTVITSGGNACTDTVRFYIVYPLQGIKMQDAPLNTITAQVNAGGGTATFTPWKSNGDTLFYKLFGAPLGGDNLLCNGESIKVIENIRVFKCAVTTTFAAGWAKTETVLPYCQTAAATSAMTMAAGVVNLGSATNTPIQTMNWCRPGIYDITVTNNGSGGKAGAAYNVLQTIGYSSSSNTVGLPGDVGTNIQGRLDSVSVNGVKVILTGTTTLSLLNTNQFTTDPDGAGIGLDDLDGDGQYDDLLPGKTYKFRIFEHWQTGTGCPIPSYNFSLRTTATFSTMCSPATTTTAQLITSYYYQTATASPSAITAPAVVQGGQPFSLQSCEGMSPTSSLPAYRPTDSVYLDVIIPVGVALAPTPNITVNGTAITNASYSVISGTPNPDTVRIRRARAGLLVFCYNIDLVYTCGAGGNLTFGMNHYYVGDASCGFIEKLSCKTTTIPAGCPGCPGGGMENLLSTATRTSLGFTDETLSTRVAAAAVTGPPRYTMLPLDTFNLASSAKANGSYNNLRYTLTFGRVASQNLVSFISGTLNIKNAVSSTVTSCTVTPVVTTTTTVQTLSYDLTTCLPGSVINTGDSVWLDQVFAMTTANNDLLLGGALTQIPNTLSRFYNVNGGGTSVYCGGTQFTIYTLGLSKNRSAGAITTNACTAAPENIRVRNGYTSTAIDYFPNEYRPYDRFDSIKLQLPAGYIFNPVYVPTATYQKWSTPTTLATVYMTGGVAGYSGSTIVYKNPYNGNWFPSDLGSTSSNQYGFNTEILANCAAQAVSAIPVSLYLTKYMYTGNPALYTPFVDATSQVLNYNLASKPIISVQNNTGTVQGTTLQHYWDVQVNSTGVNTAPNVWMAIEKGSGGIVIDSVVLKPGNTVLTPLTYNTSDTWYKVSAAGLASGSSQQARVYFKYANCNPDSVLLKAGWDCTGYPTNPATYACTAAATYLQVDPQVSQVQLSIARNTGNGSSITLCATDSVLAVINSSQSGFLVNPYLEVYPPAGITVQTPVKIEYPIGSGNYQNAAVTPITGGYKVGLSAHTGIGVNGIPGTSQNPGVTGRQAKVKIDITTDCGFTSGNALNLAAFGTRPCQAPASGSGTLSQTGPVTITGATSSGTAGISLNIPVSVLDCGQSTTVNLTATPMVLDTQTGDSVLYTLPAGLQYNGSFGGDANCASCTVNTVPGVAGTTLVKVKLQTGVASGTALNYHFDVLANGIGCGTATISGAAKRDIAGVSCGATTCSGSSVIIGTANSSTITIRKPALSTNSFNFVQDAGSYPHWIAYSFNLYNNGTLAAPANTYIVKVFCGPGATGQVLETFNANAVAAGAFVTQTGGFLLNSVADCPRGAQLSIQIQDTLVGGAKNCMCASPASSTSSVVLPVKLESFTAMLRNGAVSLQWKVADESDVAAYEVEYGYDGRNFHTLRTVSVTNAQTYNAIHNNPAAGNIYYRLKIISKDGTVVYSGIQALVVTDKNEDISIYPNPVQRIITISMNPSLTGKQATIQVLTIDGRIVTQKSIAALSRTETVDIGNVANGKYLIRMLTSDRLINKQVVVNK